MVLNKYRKQADVLLEPTAEKMSSIDPNLISLLSLVSAFIAGLFFYLYSPDRALYVLLGGIFVLLNSIFDALDGKIAKLTGKDSLRGDFLDHTIDRYADIFIIGGIVLGPLVKTWIGIFAL
ncbi:MAG: CDP-alcohol phosphatidyltransferase family protein, partial [Candidatus Aenigmatarchaeota archaeon]